MSKTNLYYILDKNKFLETYSSILKKIKVIIHKFKNLLTPYHYYFTEIKKYSNYRLPYLLYQNVYRSSIRVHAQTLVPLLMKDLGFLFIKPLQISIRLIRSSELTAGLLSRYIIFRLQRLYRLKDVVPPILEYFNRTNSFRGLRVDCAGRFDRNERATSLHFQTGKVPLNELTAQIEYSISTIRLKYGFCGIKVWLCKW